MNRILHEARNAERILQITADTLILVRQDGVCVDINTHSNLWFLQEEQLLGKNLFELLPQHTHEKMLPLFQWVISEQQKISRNFRLDLSDGTYYFKCILSPYDGMVLCQYRDITERSNVKLKLERANKELKEIQKAAQIGQWRYNSNEALFYYSGYTGIICQEEMREIPMTQYIGMVMEEDRYIFTEWMERNRMLENEESIDYRINLDGQTYYIRLKTYLREKRKDGSYNIEGYIQNTTENQQRRDDINTLTHAISTERIRYESQIKRLNRIMDTTMRNLPASIVVKDINDNFRYIYRNRRINNLDVNMEDVIGRSDFDFHLQEVAEQKRNEDQEITHTGSSIHRVIEEYDAEGNLRIIDKRKMKVESKDFSPIIISIEWDITQLEQMKRALVKEKEKAETSDKLKSAFLANMSHEIRTPLNAIVGFSRIIAESDDATERKEFYEIVDANNERLLTLINEILDLSKIESGIVEFIKTPVSVGRLCKEIYDAHVFRSPQDVELVMEPSDDEIMIDSDKNRVFQVISNLIGNAFKFTTTGSVSYGYRHIGQFIEFHVTDTGLGIDADKLGKVFERFMKANTFAQGTGLGLSICKSIIERLGGEISVTSESGKGARFCFTLPARKTKSAEERNLREIDFTKESIKITPARTENEKVFDAAKEKNKAVILIAEDTDSNYRLLNAILGKTYQLVRALNGVEAVTRFEEIKPDLILMDIRMPQMDGLEATKIIRELSPTVPIIAQSAFAYDQDQREAKEAGCNDFISKPIAQDKLKEMIEKYI